MIVLLVGLIRVYEILLLIRILSSWVMPAPRGDMMRFLYQITDPYLDMFRKALPFLATGGIDFSPIAGFLVLHLALSVLVQGM